MGIGTYALTLTMARTLTHSSLLSVSVGLIVKKRPKWSIRTKTHTHSGLCAPGGSWTRTRVAANRILSPACLPIPPPGQKKIPAAIANGIGAKDRARTGHPDLGKVVLYQMSYFRLLYKN